MVAKTVWKNEMEFDGLSESGHSIVFDGDAAHLHGPSPMEAVLMALCAAVPSTSSRSSKRSESR